MSNQSRLSLSCFSCQFSFKVTSQLCFVGLYQLLIWLNPANYFSGYQAGRITGYSEKKILLKNVKKNFCFRQNPQIFLVAISVLFCTHRKGSKKSLLIRSSHNFNILSGQPDIRQMKPDIRLDTRYKKGRISSQPYIGYNPSIFSQF